MLFFYIYNCFQPHSIIDLTLCPPHLPSIDIMNQYCTLKYSQTFFYIELRYLIYANLFHRTHIFHISYNDDHDDDDTFALAN